MSYGQFGQIKTFVSIDIYALTGKKTASQTACKAGLEPHTSDSAVCGKSRLTNLHLKGATSDKKSCLVRQWLVCRACKAVSQLSARTKCE
ncbi:MAG: hypothetical protein LBS16_04285 [Prevotellaceae bacterium]|jgi:hypothetical protein|nr:hypothetical protein [Prevotellaceae bacterium]